MQSWGCFKSVNFDDTIQSNPGALNLTTSFVSFFQGAPLERANYYKRASKYHQPKIGTENCSDKFLGIIPWTQLLDNIRQICGFKN
jgi:hypothetical protein